ncbi:MAG: VWA domain-containing protein [Planctomycetes bacterium]|nr:VWA domain-containing protein [Planctomycetota bacterium]
MTFLKRLRVLPALLGVAATLTAIGSNLFGDGRPGAAPPISVAPVPDGRPDGGRLAEELAATKFSKLPVLTYQPRDGEKLFAWQIQPTVAAPAPRPRDVLVVVDTTASQAGRPLQQARHVVAALGTSLGADDRVSVWSLSTPASTRALTRDFRPANSADVQEAARALTEVDYGSGAADLKGGLEKALATMAPNRGRHQVVLYLGDGESAYAPVAEADRLALGNRMDLADQYFFAVPLGLKLDAQNLHGLSVLTGGAVVRVQEDLAAPVKRAEFITRLKTALDVPVVKPERWAFGPEVGESFPTKLPPLRTDRPTLVMGKLAKADAGAVTASVDGVLNGRKIDLKLSQPLPAPQIDHYFLNLMLHQWRNAPHKEAPAMLQADRVLALASTQVKLYRNEFLTQAVWAVSVDRLDEADKLYAAALKVDPTDREAASGAALVAKMKSGKLSKAELAKRVAAKTGAARVDAAGIREVVQDPGTVVDPPAPGGGVAAPPGGPPAPPGGADLLAEARARRQIEEQRYRVLVDATIRRGRQLLRIDPDAAYQDLKRQRDDILAYDGIGDDARRQMVAELEGVMREVFIKGAEIKRQADAERAAIARTRQRLNEFDRAQEELARDKNRIDQFRQLMQQARYELAYQEAQLMIQEKVVKGLPVPPQATASYIIGQQATQLREWRELVRLREDRFLLTMMQTEKSHIPYPDEPPVHFPPAAVWRELTGLRREAYLNSALGNNPTESQKQLKSVIEGTEVQLKEGTNINEIPLFELLQDLSKRYQVTFVVMEEYFKAEGIPAIRDEKAKLAATQLRGLKLGAFLDVILLSMNATYIVRPDYIEITTFKQRLEEKVTRVFPVADLAIPIPSSVNQRTLFQNLSIQNQTLAIFGAASFGGQQNFLGGVNGLGAGGIGAGNALGAGGQAGPFGQGAAQQLGNQGNLGFGGGFTGFGGGQLGQFGNLGGQFGIQGGDQSGLLIQLIVETVAKGEWDPRTLVLARVPMMPGMEEDTPVLTREQQNSMGYYPPARALIVRGTNRYHPATSIKFPKDKIGGAVGAAPGGRPDGGAVVIGPGAPPQPAPMPKDPAAPRPKDPVAVNGPPAPAPIIAADRPTITDPKTDAVALRKRLGNDPKTMWSNAIDWTVTDPGLIVACAEFLMEFDEPGAAVELLKGNLRKGLATDDWAHEALAVALQAASNSSPAEVERAAVSGIDLDPTSAKAYLKAAKAEAGLKNHNQAMVFCRRAAACSPNDPTPYANAMAYAEFATDVKSDAVMWAANGLLRRDWATTDGIDYHKQANERLPRLEARLRATGQNTAALSAAITEQTQRDLVIELLWQGNADLDLIVAEPTGSVCAATQRRTTGGGVLRADILEQQNDRSEVYTAASAFSGTYRVTVKQAFGKAIGGTARLKVTKFKGTPKESTDLIDVRLSDAKSVEIRLDGGSRTTLADVAEEVNALDLRAETTGGGLPSTSGLSGGFGTAGSALASPLATSDGPALPVVAPLAEMRMPGVAAGAADIRATYRLNPDRRTYSVTVNPVFTGRGEVAMPKVPLLPGGER